MKNRFSTLLIIGLVALSLAACSSDEPATDTRPRGAAVSVTPVIQETAREIERVVGRIESADSPQIEAEVSGAVSAVLVDVGDSVIAGQRLLRLDTTDLALTRDRARSEMNRLIALHENQERTVTRLSQLRREGSVSEGALEEAESQLRALAEQLAGARSQLTSAERDLVKATVVAPIAGRIDRRLVASGDYVGPGRPLFQLAADQRLRIHLPLPETIAHRIKPGLPVTLSAPTAPGQEINAEIASVRPTVSSGSRTVEAMVTVDNPGGWLPGASVTAELLLASRENALFVPEVSVVRRPAGHVVYVVEGEQARARNVVTGLRYGGRVEIVEGLDGSETVVVDGAGFLSDGAPINVPAGDPS